MFNNLLLFQVRDVLEETTMEEDAALLSILAMKEKETVTDLEMEEPMTDTRDVRETWYVAATTARSLVSTTMRRTTAVNNQVISL